MSSFVVLHFVVFYLFFILFFATISLFYLLLRSSLFDELHLLKYALPFKFTFSVEFSCIPDPTGVLKIPWQKIERKCLCAYVLLLYYIESTVSELHRSENIFLLILLIPQGQGHVLVLFS